MFTVEQHMRENDPNIPNNPHNNNGAGSANSSPDMYQQAGMALNEGDTTVHLGDDFSLPVFTESSIITIQPNREEDGGRAAMPVYSDGWRSQNAPHFVPLNGLDFLSGAETVIIQQTVEISDILATIESANRYLVKVPRGETLYVASETSSDCQRACCGSSRGFEINFYDHTKQKAMVFKRDVACNVCWFGCCLQELKVYAAQGQLIGRILQQWTLLIPTFLVINGAGRAEFQIEGPVYLCHMSKTSEFKILSRDGTTQQGLIRNTWDSDLCMYSVHVDFPVGQINRESKALLVGAGFLLEYMFFETRKKKCCPCCSG